MKTTIIVGLSMAAFVGFINLIGISADRQAVVDCTGWQQEAAQYQTFWITPNQKEECDSVNLIINAPVRTK